MTKEHGVRNLGMTGQTRCNHQVRLAFARHSVVDCN